MRSGVGRGCTGLLSALLLLGACQAPPGAGGRPATVAVAPSDMTLEEAHARLDRHDYAGAVTILETLGKGGDAKAEVALARLYAFGPRELQAPSEGAGWAQRAATQGDAGGEAVLGLLYLNGVGVA